MTSKYVQNYLPWYIFLGRTQVGLAHCSESTLGLRNFIPPKAFSSAHGIFRWEAASCCAPKLVAEKHLRRDPGWRGGTLCVTSPANHAT